VTATPDSNGTKTIAIANFVITRNAQLEKLEVKPANSSGTRTAASVNASLGEIALTLILTTPSATVLIDRSICLEVSVFEL